MLGVLGVWLVKPIGDACPDVGQLPAGSTGSSSPSFAPPLTRTCTYTTADGTKARKRYVPVVDWLVLAVVAGAWGRGVGLAGPGTPRPRARAARRAPRAPSARRGADAACGGAAPRPRPLRRAGAGAGAAAQTAEDRAAEREREREERARRRERG